MELGFLKHLPDSPTNFAAASSAFYGVPSRKKFLKEKEEGHEVAFTVGESVSFDAVKSPPRNEIKEDEKLKKKEKEDVKMRKKEEKED